MLKSPEQNRAIITIAPKSSIIASAVRNTFNDKGTLLPNKDNLKTSQADRNQAFVPALKEAFSHKGYILLVAGFFVCGFQITLVGTHIPGYMQDRGLGGWSATIILALIGLATLKLR